MRNTQRQYFYIASLKINDNQFSIETFKDIEDEIIEDFKVSDEIQETRKVKKEVRDNRFILVYFEEGGIYPRPEKVYNTETLNDEKNPRQKGQIERDIQTFFLIDIEQQKIYFSNFKRKKVIEDWLSKKLDKLVIIKNIIDHKNFLEKIKSVDTIYFSANKTLFSKFGILDDILSSDENNYGTGIKNVCLKITFQENITVPEKMKNFVKNIITEQQNHSLDKLEITGRYDDKFESVFNGEEVIDKKYVTAEKKDDGLINYEVVFSNLIIKIKI